MVKVVRVVVLPLAMLFALLVAPAARAAPPLPDSMAALGDSITQANDTCCWYGDHPRHSWSTGGSARDKVNSQYERLVALNPDITSQASNFAVSGAKANGLSAQVSAAVALEPDYLTLLIGANDLCTSSAGTMTSTTNFAIQISASLAALHEGLPETEIFVSSIPNLHQLWSVLHGSWVARKVWSTAGICQSMLASTNTETDRQQVVAREGAFNQILAQACGQYARCRWDGYATYNHPFSKSQISRLDYFHPNRRGQAALAQVTWKASRWGG